jgi:DNA-binding NarL/FixJ family response regulator
MWTTILLVDDFEPWRRVVCSMVKKEPGLSIICEVSDGLEAVQKAVELKPDLVMLDIGLPTINGIEAARRIRQISPNSKIGLLSQDNSLDVVQVALSTGAQGYVHTIDAALRGEGFPPSCDASRKEPNVILSQRRRH